jgi:hypothetical protein
MKLNSRTWGLATLEQEYAKHRGSQIRGSHESTETISFTLSNTTRYSGEFEGIRKNSSLRKYVSAFPNAGQH